MGIIGAIDANINFLTIDTDTEVQVLSSTLDAQNTVGGRQRLDRRDAPDEK